MIKSVACSFLALFVLLFEADGGSIKKELARAEYDLRAGDVLFQNTGGAQGAAVHGATGSTLTHCGVLFFDTKGQGFVLEAVQPVKVTPLKKWRARSKLFYAMRLKDDRKLNGEVIRKAQRWGEVNLGKNYDSLFRWDDKSLYCSELVWKIYHHSTGIELCPKKTFGEFNLKNPAVQKLIVARYGGMKNVPMEEPVVAPSDLAESSLLMEVPRK